MHFALLVLALAAVDQATTPTPNPIDQQVERVRAALEKPPSKLTVPEVRADFSVHIEVRRPLQDIFDKPVWQLPPIGWQPPAVGYTAFGGMPMVNIDLMAIGRVARRAYAEHNASEEVRQAIAEYCAVQPNAATISICSGAGR